MEIVGEVLAVSTEQFGRVARRGWWQDREGRWLYRRGRNLVINDEDLDQVGFDVDVQSASKSERERRSGGCRGFNDVGDGEGSAARW